MGTARLSPARPRAQRHQSFDRQSAFFQIQLLFCSRRFSRPGPLKQTDNTNHSFSLLPFFNRNAHTGRQLLPKTNNKPSHNNLALPETTARPPLIILELYTTHQVQMNVPLQLQWSSPAETNFLSPHLTKQHRLPPTYVSLIFPISPTLLLPACI